MTYKHIVIITILAIGLTANETWGRRVYGYIEKVDCLEYNPNYVKALRCWINSDDYSYGALNTLLVLKQNLTSIYCQYRIVADWNSKNITYLSLDTDICLALATVFHNPLLGMIAHGLRQASNFPLECPLRKGVKYILSNFTVSHKFLPSFAPSVSWTTYSHFYTDSSKKIELLKYIVTGRLDGRMPRG